MNRYRPSIIRRDGMRERVKAKTDVVHAHFHTLRFLARIRCQQARRLYDAVTAARQEVAAAKRPVPHDFSYEEIVATATGRPIRQRVLLTLWDPASLWDHAVARGLPLALRGPRVHRRRWSSDQPALSRPSCRSAPGRPLSLGRDALRHRPLPIGL